MFEQFSKKSGLYDPQLEKDSCGVGFVCNVKGVKSNSIIRDGMKVLNRLSHRGAVGADPKTGDGGGILIQTPHRFFRKISRECKIDLPDPGLYGSGLVFLPSNGGERKFCKEVFEKVISEHNQVLLGWREVPIDDSDIGKGAKDSEPAFEQIFIGASDSDQMEFERKLYVIRKQTENIIYSSNLKQKESFYITNISSRTFCYKGLLTPAQVGDFFLDLKDESMESSLCLVHSRYSTNTSPTWNLAQPFRFLAHNGEINTLRGNINWISSRERMLASDLFDADMERLKPVIVKGGSDSAAIDNVFELLVLSGRSLEHAMMMLIPAAWENDRLMDRGLKDFYKYHACFMEPWDGPAAIAFTDGSSIGAVLDRNGLRPARYIVTRKGLVVMASEVGVLDIDPAEIEVCGRLEPGKIFFINTVEGRIVNDSEIKVNAASRSPYGRWNDENMLDLDELPAGNSTNICGVVNGVSEMALAKAPDEQGQRRDEEGKTSAELSRSPRDNGIYDTPVSCMRAFGYSREDLRVIIKPMAKEGKEPVGSMGNDTPHAFLSKRPQLLYNYFKQLFAQVTNPAIDPIREKLVMSLEGFMGPEKNMLEETPGHSRKLRVKNPILTDEELVKIRDINVGGFRTKTIYAVFDAVDGREGLVQALDRVCRESVNAISEGYSFIILSDRGVGRSTIPLPMLLSVSAVHQHLVCKNIRSQVAIIVESAEPREVHHFALLFGYGASCVNPYLAFRAIGYLVEKGEISLDETSALKNYNKALTEGILKVLSKMGISTLRSYRGAQIFEALGLDREFVDRYFTGTVSRIGGVGIDGIIEETLKRHEDAWLERDVNTLLPGGGIYQWKKDGEFHLWNPESIAALQDAARTNNRNRYREFAQMINDQSASPVVLRSLLEFKKCKPISIDEVEPVQNIMRRFTTGAMSFGSISRATHETIAIAMNRMGGKSNTGEGGEDPNRFVMLPDGDSKRSAIKQVASGRFGVTLNYLVNADEIQIKIAQGAKPGEGGQLPGHKVSAIIARTRYTTEGVTLISPPPHHDIYSIEDLAQLIFDLKNANPNARISVKLVSEIGVGTVAAGVAKGHANVILISGGDGGTGASPITSIRHAGLPWELGLSETHQTLIINNLRSKVRLRTDGQMRTGRDVAIAALLGAEEYGFSTAVLVTIGCVMLRHCHLNNCSVGVATQDDVLQKRFTGRPEYITNYLRFVAEELREIMAGLGIETVDEMVGRTDLLLLDATSVPSKVKGVDFSGILAKPDPSPDFRQYDKKGDDLVSVLDKSLIRMSFEKKGPVRISSRINNANRATGTMLSGEVCRRFGEDMLLEDTIVCKFNGVAGQSFGAFLAKGITFELEGMANDYVGKGISGGKIIIYPDRRSRYEPDKNIIIGNTTFYGAISGEAYVRGVAGERFCIRNSGLYAVVEGVGDHGCEYMTGGRVVVLGRTGRNFAAGMSGGIAYVYDEEGTFRERCNMDMVELEGIKGEDADVICNLLYNHSRHTRSLKAKRIIGNIREELKRFVRVIPMEYKSILEGVKVEKNSV